MNFTYILKKNHKEGFGSYYERAIFTLLLTKLLKFVNYYHTNNSYYHGHDVDLSDIKVNETKWKSLFNFLEKYTYSSTLKISVPYLISYSIIRFIPINIRNKFFIRLRDEFYSCIPSDIITKRFDKFTVVLHLRDQSPGDVIHGVKSFPWKLFSVDYKVLNFRPKYNIRILSKFIYDNYKNFDEFNLIIHSPSTNIHQENLVRYLISILPGKFHIEHRINSNNYDAFLDFLSADILICSHSSFSWLASLLRNKKSFIRGKYHHFLSENTEVIREIIYDKFKNDRFMKLKIYLLLKYQYLILYSRITYINIFLK